jgi:hypothetical protein
VYGLIAHLRRASIAGRIGAGHFSRPGQRVLVALDEVGESDAFFAAGVEGAEALFPSFAEEGRPRAVFIGRGRSTLRVIVKSRSSRRLSTSSCFSRASTGTHNTARQAGKAGGRRESGAVPRVGEASFITGVVFPVDGGHCAGRIPPR